MAAPSIVVVIREDPTKTHRAVEALRIALGLSTGSNPLTVVLLGQAALLLSEDRDALVEVDILEKHLPVLQELEIPFVAEEGVRDRVGIEDGWSLEERAPDRIADLIAQADRVLVF